MARPTHGGTPVWTCHVVRLGPPPPCRPRRGCAAQSAGANRLSAHVAVRPEFAEIRPHIRRFRWSNLEYLTATPAAHSMRWAFPPPNRLSLFYRYSTFRASRGLLISKPFCSLLLVSCGLFLPLAVCGSRGSLSLSGRQLVVAEIFGFRGPSLTRASFRRLFSGPSPLSNLSQFCTVSSRERERELIKAGPGPESDLPSSLAAMAPAVLHGSAGRCDEQREPHRSRDVRGPPDHAPEPARGATGMPGVRGRRWPRRPDTSRQPHTHGH